MRKRTLLLIGIPHSSLLQAQVGIKYTKNTQGSIPHIDALGNSAVLGSLSNTQTKDDVLIDLNGYLAVVHLFLAHNCTSRLQA